MTDFRENDTVSMRGKIVRIARGLPVVAWADAWSCETEPGLLTLVIRPLVIRSAMAQQAGHSAENEKLRKILTQLDCIAARSELSPPDRLSSIQALLANFKHETR